MAQAPKETTDETPDRDEIPPTQRKKAKKQDNYRCQLCPNRGPERGGDIPLNVHHKSYHPDECGLHDLPNLITLCKDCHDWHHNKPDAEELPITITDAAADKMKPIDYGILYALHDAGPLTPDEISERIQPNNTANAIIERLWQIMRMDNRVNEQSQLIHQDAETDEWGLPEQIETSRRGIPTHIKTLVRRIHDALILDALTRGCSRETVANAFGIYQRTTYKIEKRGLAYDFPLKEYTGPGRPKEDDYLIVDLSDSEVGEEPQIQQMVDALTNANGGSSDTTTVDTDNASTNRTGNGNNATANSDLDVGDANSVETLPTRDNHESVDQNEIVDPDQPHIDGSNREYLITADDYPEGLRETIHRLNLTKIAKREEGQVPVDPDSQFK